MALLKKAPGISLSGKTRFQDAQKFRTNLGSLFPRLSILCFLMGLGRLVSISPPSLGHFRISMHHGGYTLCAGASIAFVSSQYFTAQLMESTGQRPDITTDFRNWL